MTNQCYEFEMGASGKSFLFYSLGPKGRIPKVVAFSELDTPGIYNLGFGDYDFSSGMLDDAIRSNNGDAEMVLSTVVQTVIVFTDHNPGAIIFAKGSTAARTRLYQIGLSQNLDEVEAHFDLYGLVGKDWETFRRCRKYDAFLAKRKK